MPNCAADAEDAPPLVLVGNRGWLFDEAMRLINSLKLTEHVRYFENLPDTKLRRSTTARTACR